MILYDIAFIVFSIFYIPFSLYKKGLRSFNVKARLGFMPPDVRAGLAAAKNIWIHAVSVGEAMVLGEFTEGLKNQFPDYRIVISTTTKTGNDVAKSLVNGSATVVYSPFDLSFAVKRFLSAVRPRVLIIAETELWPNLIGVSKRRNVPVIVINGRISPRSFGRYKAVRPLLRSMLKKIDLFCMQSSADADRMISIGADKEKVRITGNMKFDIVDTAAGVRPPITKGILGLSEGDILIVAGSTHKGEEEILLDAYRDLSREFKNLKLLIAPRHINRAPQIRKLMKNTQGVFLLDTVGQLREFYSIADIVFVGGSLVRHGGQNPIEPAYFSKPVIFGTFMFNFAHISQILLESGAGIEVKDGIELKKAITSLINEPDRARQMGDSAKKAIEANKGASSRNVGLIKIFL